MNFEKIKSDEMNLEYKVTFLADEIEKAVQKEVANRAKTFKMQGFRKGHVPLDIVRKNVEYYAIQEVLEKMVNDACDNVIKENNVRDLTTRPTYRFEKQYVPGEDVVIIVTVDPAPEFELKPYETEIDKVVAKISDEDIDVEIKKIMELSPFYEKAPRDRAIEPKDEVKYEAQCYNKGVFSKKKSFSNSVIIPDAIPEDAEFLKNFVGKKVGESFDFVPATDKNLTYKIMIRSVRKELRDISVDDYAKRTNIKNVEEFRKLIKNTLQRKFDSQAYIYHKNQILENLTAQYDFKLPQKILDQEMKTVLATVKKEYEDQVKAAEKDSSIKMPEKKSEEELTKEYSDVVKKRVLLGYVLNRIAKQEKITASDKEVTAVINSEIRSTPHLAQHIINYYKNNKQAIIFKRAEIIEQKVVSFLIDKAKAKSTKELTQSEIDEIVKKLLEDEE